MARSSYLVAYLVRISDLLSRVVVIVVTRYDPPLIKIYNTPEEANGAIRGITGVSLPELMPISKDVFWSKVQQLKKEDEKLSQIDFGPVMKSLS